MSDDIVLLIMYSTIFYYVYRLVINVIGCIMLVNAVVFSEGLYRIAEQQGIEQRIAYRIPFVSNVMVFWMIIADSGTWLHKHWRRLILALIAVFLVLYYYVVQLILVEDLMLCFSKTDIMVSVAILLAFALYMICLYYAFYVLTKWYTRRYKRHLLLAIITMGLSIPLQVLLFSRTDRVVRDD